MNSPTASSAAPVHPHEAELKNEDGSWKFTNKLIDETSPYLLQHAHNPVDWYAWGPEAFEASRKTGKPIFLSIGYSTCYWCHVMERLVFENPKIAARMNELFISIKVDREEHPDVDDIYMAATMLINRSGGWPMSVFLTPPGAKGEDDRGLLPYYAGTYFPPEPQQGMPGFPQLMEAMANAWTEQREQVLTQADQVAEAVSQYVARRGAAGELTPDLVRNAADQLLSSYDAQHGGFGSGRNKFPQPNNLLLLVRTYQDAPNDRVWAAISYTLERMARGGMYDQVGGGFHRYSTDRQWLIPHFEKMLYDNGQLTEAYVIAHETKPHEQDPDFYPRVIRSICDYVLREMTDDTGTFWSAQDAEVDAREGGNYVWIEAQVREAIADEKLADLAVVMYGLDRGTNFQDPHHADEPPTNVLYLPTPLHEVAKQQDMSMAELLAAKAKIDQQLLTVRTQRKQPSTDDKVLVAWNGLMIGGLARAGRVLDEKRYTDAAAKAADYILKHMRTQDGGLYRSMRQGEIKILAFLEDYAFFMHGLLQLHRTTQDAHWLDAAVAMNKAARQRFSADGGGYYDTLADQSDLFVRSRTIEDGAISSGNSQMVHNLLDLYELSDEPAYLQWAIADLHAVSGLLAEYGASMSHMQHALARALKIDPAAVAAAGQQDAGPALPGFAARPVKVTLEPQTVDLSTGQATVKIKMTISPEYHLNSNTPSMDMLIATSVTLVGGDGLEAHVSYPEGETKRFSFADQDLSVYDGQIQIDVTLRKTGDLAAGAAPKLVLEYQACTDSACLQPEQIELPLKFE